MGYIRDGRAPLPESEITSKIMSAIGGKNTEPELALRKALREIGISGYRLHWKRAPGRADIAYPGRKMAVFVHGCFWHRCPYCNPALPKTHTEFWIRKFEKNKERDTLMINSLKAEGWRVLVFWECEIKKDVFECAIKVKSSFREKFETQI
jgi:DNA mismatch endonuclease (patch repair protein)